MQTLEEKYTEWVNAMISHHSVAGIDSYTAFRAGAAAMAELFANGQALKISNAINQYTVTRSFIGLRENHGGLAPERVFAYSADEACQILRNRDNAEGKRYPCHYCAEPVIL